MGTAWGHGSPQICAGQGHWPLPMPPACSQRVTPDPEQLRPLSGCRPPLLQVFEEEHHILYLDHGGVIVAIKDSSIPLKILK